MSGSVKRESPDGGGGGGGGAREGGHPCGILGRERRGRRYFRIANQAAVAAAFIRHCKGLAQFRPHVGVRRTKRDRNARERLANRPVVNLALGPPIRAADERVIV